MFTLHLIALCKMIHAAARYSLTVIEPLPIAFGLGWCLTIAAGFPISTSTPSRAFALTGAIIYVVLAYKSIKPSFLHSKNAVASHCLATFAPFVILLEHNAPSLIACLVQALTSASICRLSYLQTRASKTMLIPICRIPANLIAIVISANQELYASSIFSATAAILDFFYLIYLTKLKSISFHCD